MDYLIEFFSQVAIGLFVIIVGTALIAVASFIRKNQKENSQTDEYIEEVGERLIDRGEHLIFRDEDSSVAIPNKEIKIKKGTINEKVNNSN